jgi:hypothetical protein
MGSISNASSLILLLSRNVTSEERDRCRGEAMTTLRKLLDLETTPVFTQNFDFLDGQKRHWNALYTKDLNKRNKRSVRDEPYRDSWSPEHSIYSIPVVLPHASPNSSYNPAIHIGGTTWPEIDVREALYTENLNDHEGFSPPTPVHSIFPTPVVPPHAFPKCPYDPAIDGGETTWSVQEEIDVMASVQAYFQVAHKVRTPRDRIHCSYVVSSPFHSVSLTMCHWRSNTT